MTEREPAPESGNEGEAVNNGGGESGGEEPIHTPTNLGDFEIREGDYGPLSDAAAIRPRDRNEDAQAPSLFVPSYPLEHREDALQKPCYTSRQDDSFAATSRSA